MFSALSGCVGSSNNLLKNPGFEEVTDGEPDFWFHTDNDEVLKCEWNNSISHNGKACVSIINNEEGVIGDEVFWVQMISNEKVSEERLKLTGWVKTENAIDVKLVIYCGNLNDDEVEGESAIIT